MLMEMPFIGIFLARQNFYLVNRLSRACESTISQALFYDISGACLCATSLEGMDGLKLRSLFVIILGDVIEEFRDGFVFLLIHGVD